MIRGFSVFFVSFITTTKKSVEDYKSFLPIFATMYKMKEKKRTVDEALKVTGFSKVTFYRRMREMK